MKVGCKCADEGGNLPGPLTRHMTPRRYFEGKCSYKHLYLPMYPAGRVMHLRRVEREKGSRAWDAVWVRHCCLIDEGILVSRHQSSDHSIARLRNVFAELAGKDVPELAGADGGEDLV